MHRNVNALINYIYKYFSLFLWLLYESVYVKQFELFYFVCITDREREEGSLMLVGFSFFFLFCSAMFCKL